MTQRRVVTFDDDVIGVHRETTTRKMAASVSCGNYRCLQERKQLRKELEKSRKQFISSIGFECVVKELYGADSVKRITPFNDEETREPEDWDPSFAEICQLCMARKQLVKESIARHERYIDEYTGKLETKDVGEGQPLDLSRAGVGEEERSTGSPLALTTPRKSQSSLKVPLIKVKNKNKLARHGKTGTYSNYTQADLKLALIDVRSGKIGTRRASVLYGIPRSTIRNHLNRNSFLNDDEKSGAQNNRFKRISPKVEPKEKDTDKPKKPLPQDTNSYGSVCFTKDGEDVISRLRKHLEEVEKCKTRIDGKQTVGRLLLQEMLSGQANKARDPDDNSKINHESSLPKSVFEYLIEKHLENVNEMDTGENRENIQSQTKNQVDPNIKVPDFRAVNGGPDKDKPFVVEETRNNAAVINEWFKRSASPLMDMTSQEHDSVANSTSGISISSDEYNGQGKRPKRGRYRCYDRESLMQAVNAVQRGEMTVTRAGNVFGVPHSTLEYKVKERHLKRNAKRAAEEKAQTSGTHSDHSDSNQSPQAPEIFKQQRLGPAAMMYPIGNSIMPSYDSFASRLRAISERQLWHNMFPYSIDPEALRHLSESASHYYRSHPLYSGQYLDEEYYLLNERQSTSLGLHPPPRESLADDPRTDPESGLPGTYDHTPPVKQEAKREKGSNINNIIEKLLEAQIYQQVKNIRDPSSSPTPEDKEEETSEKAVEEEEEEPTARDLSNSTRKRPTEDEEEEESIPTKKSCHDDAENSKKITENIGAIPV